MFIQLVASVLIANVASAGMFVTDLPSAAPSGSQSTSSQIQFVCHASPAGLPKTCETLVTKAFVAIGCHKVKASCNFVESTRFALPDHPDQSGGSYECNVTSINCISATRTGTGIVRAQDTCPSHFARVATPELSVTPGYRGDAISEVCMANRTVQNSGADSRISDRIQGAAAPAGGPAAPAGSPAAPPANSN